MNKGNSYYYSKLHNVISLKKEEEVLSSLFKENKKRSLKKEFSGKLDINRIRYEFTNTQQILFEVTDACNLKCKYCAYGEYYCNYEKRKSVNLTLKKARVLIDFYLNLRNSSLFQSCSNSLTIGFYGGEPLLNIKLIKDIINYLEPNIPGCNYTMTTNGTLLDKHIDFLVAKNFELLVSLDGNGENNSYRVFKDNSISFTIVYDNLKKIQKQFPDYFREKININACLHNKNSVTEIYDFINTEFYKVPRISELSPNGIRDDMKEDFLKKYRNFSECLVKSEKCSEIIDAMDVSAPERKELIHFLFDFCGNTFKNYNELFVDTNITPKIPLKTCAPFSRKIFLTAGGKILPCERIGQLFYFGKVTDSKVIIDFEKLADRQNYFYSVIKKKCLKCGNLRHCNMCLFWIIDNKKEVSACPFYTNDQLAFGKYIATQISKLEINPHLYEHIWNDVVLD